MLLSPFAYSLHRHIFFFHFTAIDKHFTNTAIRPAVFTGITKEVQRTTVTEINITASLDIHNKVIHQRITPGQDVLIAQRACVDLSAGR
ncbi:Uncharacterised protein [Salmonella enterica subsp. enterica serovar Bovismorbificans]|uniref:Uncharacterized protein n=1 Tax=Salmonella enterica subsp. enterica serovar Bovismorbificans TaxID=58097 RepID=A0A655C993_SALET|nr:Uncharacterised protein [Salmonella enterica subsp. enterica serovar Bovismorbificans]